MVFKKHVQKAIYGIMLLGIVLSTLGASLPQAQSGTPSSQGTLAQTTDEIQGFGLATTTDGWILLGRHLYWSSTNGDNWSDITPALPSAAAIYAVKFLDIQTGWVLWANNETNGNLVFQIAHTSDQGRNWKNTVVQALTPDDPDINVENASMGWLDENTGWVSLKLQTGSNFSSGTLFRTDDGGQTWRRSSLPIGSPVYFVDSQVGWMAGGPAGDQLFKTQDGGNTWEKQSLPAGLDGSQSFSVYPPVFDSPNDGLLTIVSLNGDTFQIGFYSTSNGGQDWISVASLPLGSKVGAAPLSMLDARDLVAAVPNANRLIQMVNREVKTVINRDGMSAAVIDLDMVSSDFGWAKWNTSTCEEQSQPSANASTNINCTSVTKLIRTTDGGITWQAILLPGIASDTLTQNTSATHTSPAQVGAASQGNTRVLVGQGFDICTIPTLSQLQTWWDSSPYRAVNLYIGGSARASGCSYTALSTSFLNQLGQQGWNFIPTWVGPQAPCSSNIPKFSSDVNTAYSEGVNEANLAVETLAALGLTFPDKTGSVVYYDLETYADSKNTGCYSAAKAFINGWVAQLHVLGNLAGVYGSTGCPNGLNNFLQIANVPDVIWPAIWDHSSPLGAYNPNASIWGLGCIANTSWANHQRIRQYEGGNNETWGGVTLNIDNDVLDGVVAFPYQDNITPPPSASFYASPLVGNAPLAVTLYIADTANIAVCAWDYGDGQYGNSCAASHTHTYNNAGTYTVSLVVAGPGGSNTLTRTDYITAGQTPPPSQPDLLPFPRPGRLNPVILSSDTGTSTDSTLYAGKPVYIDWGFKNNATADITSSFKADLYIDDQLIIDYSIGGLAAGGMGGYDDSAVTWNTAGWHSVKLVLDPANSVLESNENNNIWTGRFNWESTVPTGPATISPSGTVSTSPSTYKWYAVTGDVSSYELYVNSLGSGSNVFSITAIPVSICVSSICTYNIQANLSPGDYQFKVIVKYYDLTSAFSAWMTFTVGGAPAAPVVITPAGAITDSLPSFSWTKSAAASWYELYVYPAGSSTAVISETSIPASSNCSTSVCTWTTSTLLGRGDYQFNVRADNLSGSSDLSASGIFSVDADLFYIYVPMVIHP